MPLVLVVIETVHYTGANTIGRLMPDTQLHRHFIRLDETDAPYVINHPVWIAPHFIDSLIAVFFINFCCISRRNIMRLEKDHDVADVTVLCPAFDDRLELFLAEPGNFFKLFRRFV